MTLSEVIALRPQGTDAAAIGTAINRAEAARESALARADQLEREMAASLLTASDEEMVASERDAADARRRADRITALLGEMRTALADAKQREQAAGDAAMVAEAVRLDELFVKAWDRHLVQIAEGAAKIVAAQRAADLAIDRARGALGDTALPRHVWGGDDGANMTVYVRSNRLARIEYLTHLAEMAPSVIAMRQQEDAQTERRERERRAAESAEAEARAAVYRAERAREAAEDERQRQARTIPPLERAVVRISGAAA